MKIGADEVRHVAGLAEIAVADADLDLLAHQLDGIVNFVAQLQELGLDETAAGVVVGPASTPLRADVVDPVPLTRTPAEIAPAFEQGFFVVPRLGGMASE